MKEKTFSHRDNAPLTPLPGPTPPPRRILVVEDDSNIRQLNSEVLTQSGYHVVAAGDGAAAWNTLQLHGYDLLITDNEMPWVTGVDLLKKLHAAHLAVPVIMATETPPMDEFTRCPWLLPAAMLTKPYTIDELLGTVREVLRATDSRPQPDPPPPASQKRSGPEDWFLL
jgi:DNA-binding response OmpR family regulator